MAIEDAVFTVNQIQNKSLDLVDKFYEDRAQGVFYLDKDIVYLGKNSSETVTITGDGNGKAFTVSVSDESIATASINGNVITLTGKNTVGATTVTIKDAGSISYKPSEKTIAVNVAAGALATADPADIQKTIKMGLAPKVWSVGDRAPIVLDGTVGSYTFSNYTAYAYILGFDHNADIEGANRVHFQFAFNTASAGTHIAFCDNLYDSSGSNAMFHMNSSDTNTGGWSSSYMRNTICSQFLAAMPKEWQNIISECTKYTDNTGGGKDTSSYVTATTEKIFLPSEFEIFGTKAWANSAEQNYQKQYDYYKNGNSKIMQKSGDPNTAAWWWLRSPHSGYSAYFCGVAIDGSASSTRASLSRGFAPCFTIA